MRLTQLELHGFKSFADNTRLVFEPGVTAVVGPNGCGKSNVSDAIRWVLGEQRARMMRGAKMDEVIFQGSSARRAVNVAEVSLHFDNDDGSLPIAYREVVITRRLSRSGESEYLLNRVPCRLRDIHDLLRGTGLGSDAGVVIESRMIDALLSDRPDDRRDLFEEAAGVGLYRDRRRSTERRLEETTTDLQRLDDLISEVQTQVRSLARQRKRAERHVELTERRYTVEIALAAREMAAWHEELGRLEEKLVGLRAAMPDVDVRIRDAEQARDAAHAARTVAEGRRSELSRLAAELRQQAFQLRGEMAVAEERQRNAVARRQRAEEEQREGEAHGVRLATDREQAAAERVRLEEQLRETTEQLRGRTAAEEAARAAVTEARAAVEAAERRARELQDRARRLEHDRERAQRELDEIAQRAERLEAERTVLTDTANAVTREMEAAAAAAESANASVAAANAAMETARVHARALRDEDASARAELFRADEQHTALQAKVNALDALERERVGLAPAAARLLKDRDTFGEGAILGPLSDFIAAGQASALLVERFLGPTVHAIVVRDADVTERVRQWHASANPGPLLLLPLDAAPSEERPDGDAGDTLASVVEAAAPAQGWVRALLGRARSVDAGAAFIDTHGAVWLPGSVAGPGPLRRRAELSALREELEKTSLLRQRASVIADESRVALEAAEASAAAAADAAAEAQRSARRASEQQGELGRRVERATRELHEAEGLAARLARKREELNERIAILDDELSESGAQIVERQADVAAARERFTTAEGAQEEAREARTRWQVEQAQAQARLQVASDREHRLAQEFDSASHRLHSLRSELSTLSEADSVLGEQMATWRMDLEAREATLADAEARVADAERGVADADQAFTAAEQALDDVRRRTTAQAEELHLAELRFTELSGRRTAIRQRLEAEWRRPLELMIANVVPMDLDDEALRTEASTLRDQLESLGPVNVLAVEEHDEALKRFDFLSGQRTDLADARQSLQQAIREIDTTARELFLATFTQVRENFRQIFMTLFGGGECDLRLENPEAPLDCDIEVHASPRGKRTQRIHLLSSGERALVALSLLFGIFLTKPSPFCLLDEVDAPLDDANIGRFVRMLNQFKMRTQFIVITHNPRTTTEAADAVYGVTMQEPGVSSIVSVRMRGRAVDDAEVARDVSVHADAPEAEEAAAPA